MSSTAKKIQILNAEIKDNMMKNVMEVARVKRQALQQAIEEIKEHKRKNKLLYRKYYIAQKDCDDYIREQLEDEDICDIIKGYFEVDISDLFYNKIKRDN